LTKAELLLTENCTTRALPKLDELVGITLSVLACMSSGTMLQARQRGNIGSREAEDDRAEPDEPPGAVPDPGVPLQVRTVASFFATWDSQVNCDNQFTPAIRDVLRSTILSFDPLGSTWAVEDL
jgi:hypothetical protein